MIATMTDKQTTAPPQRGANDLVIEAFSHIVKENTTSDISFFLAARINHRVPYESRVAILTSYDKLLFSIDRSELSRIIFPVEMNEYSKMDYLAFCVTAMLIDFYVNELKRRCDCNHES